MKEKLKAARDKLQKELQEKAETLILEEIETKMNELHREENDLQGRIKTLSLYPTVGIPNALFGLALSFLLLGVYQNAQPFAVWLILSLTFTIIGVAFLAKSLTMIQKAAVERI